MWTFVSYIPFYCNKRSSILIFRNMYIVDLTNEFINKNKMQVQKTKKLRNFRVEMKFARIHVI